MQIALTSEGIGHFKVRAVSNDVIAAKLALPKAAIGLVIGTGFNFSVVDPKGKIVNTEIASFRTNLLTETSFDWNILAWTDPIHRHAIEKVISGNYLGLILRSHLRALRDRDEFGSAFSSAAFIDFPYRLRLGEFETRQAAEGFVAILSQDADRLGLSLPGLSADNESFERLTSSGAVFRLFEESSFSGRLTGADGDLYMAIKRKYSTEKLATLPQGQMADVTRSLQGQQLQRALLEILYPDDVPCDNPNVYWTTLISFIEDAKTDDVRRFRQDLCATLDLDARDVFNHDLKTMREVSRDISRRAGRLAAAAILGVIRQLDPHIATNYVIAVDGAVYARHPKMHCYIEAAMETLRSQDSSDLGGGIEFQLVPDAVGIGAAIAAAQSVERAAPG